MNVIDIVDFFLFARFSLRSTLICCHCLRIRYSICVFVCLSICSPVSLFINPFTFFCHVSTVPLHSIFLCKLFSILIQRKFLHCSLVVVMILLSYSLRVFTFIVLSQFLPSHLTLHNYSECVCDMCVSLSFYCTQNAHVPAIRERLRMWMVSPTSITICTTNTRT